MNKSQPGNKSYQGSEFERIFIACLAVVTAAILIYLTIAGRCIRSRSAIVPIRT
jgi:hypothetical protein